MPTLFSRNPLKRPFPDREFDRALVLGHLRTAFFIFAALYVLKPFGLDFGHNALLICMGYGLVTFIVAVGYSYVTDRLLNWQRNGPGWTLGKWVLDCALLLMLISLANFLFHNLIVGFGGFSLVVLFAIAVPTVLIGLFPIAISGVFIQMQAENNNQRAAGTLARFAGLSPDSPTPFAPALAPLSDEFSVAPEAVLFCESRQNYVRIAYLDAGAPRERTIRATLASVEEKLGRSGVIRCHRSYLVNTNRVVSARGNAQGLRLSLVGVEEEIPVSRAFVAALRETAVG